MKSKILSLLFFLNFLDAECSDLNYADCLYWSALCEWNEEVDQCQDLGNGGGEVNNGYIEGGDILRINDHFIIGISSRTNTAGAENLSNILNLSSQEELCHILNKEVSLFGINFSYILYNYQLSNNQNLFPSLVILNFFLIL